MVGYLGQLGRTTSGNIPQGFDYVGMLFGVAGIGAIFILPLGFLGPVVGIIWCLWLGVLLLRA